MRSSNEWKVMMQSLPPGFKISLMPFRLSSNIVSSRLTSILNAWKVLFPGWPPVFLLFAGMDASKTSIRSPVTSNVFSCLLSTMFFAIRFANFSSP